MLQAKEELCLVEEGDIIICPHCYAPTLFSSDIESECSVCRREITQSDIEAYWEGDDV